MQLSELPFSAMTMDRKNQISISDFRSTIAAYPNALIMLLKLAFAHFFLAGVVSLQVALLTSQQVPDW